MNKRKRSKISYIIPVSFLLALGVLGGYNLKSAFPVVRENIKSDKTYLEEGTGRLEEDYRTSFAGRQSFVDFYGLVQKGMGRKTAGNMEFVRTGTGLMDYVTKESDVMPFAEEMSELKSILDAKNIPLLYVQMPVREEEGSQEPETLIRTRAYYDEIRKVTDGAGIVCMDEEEILAGEGAPVREEFYFKGDVHPTTKGEIWTANKIADKLKGTFGVPIPGVIKEDDPRFEKHSHPFMGNLVQSLGQYYVGLDEFEEYIPKRQPAYHLEELSGAWEMDGTYEEVIMNGYDKDNEDEKNTYWVTNYLRYGSAGYHVENLNSDGPSILFISDSLCYRTMSYLSLQCKNITVIDPRFLQEGQGDPVSQALNSKSYDAVIYLHGTFYTTDYSMFGEWTLKEE